ncbi:unnamed protein product [Zymoseptoria tritici ST99CH_1A5]|uniref:Uncharacterized protein n=1 Tax=Zymoseptoria tritici ST99CH_1A5 TaxID=1276529 RepID=A0A1Y6LQT2_ZYMTR|nr:unnamed protein product [Zymoseptoria tritici ST99CH_1A5]
MSRFFSSSKRLAKTLKWKLIGTTENVAWATAAVEAAVEHVPELKDRVDSAVVNGNPHPTGSDPLHVSGAIGKGSVKNRNRVTSYHAYPDGTVVFSDKKLPRLRVTASGVEVLATGGPTATASSSRHENTGSRLSQQDKQPGTVPPGWAYDGSANMYKFWDGQKWDLWQYTATVPGGIRWDGTKWVKREQRVMKLALATNDLAPEPERHRYPSPFTPKM